MASTITFMTEKEASELKKEILKLEGSIMIGNTIKVDRVVYIDDIIKCINKHIKWGEKNDKRANYQKSLDSVLDEVRERIEQEYIKFRNKSSKWCERACGLGTALEIIDMYKVEKMDYKEVANDNE